jgi:hypothetical protein
MSDSTAYSTDDRPVVGIERWGIPYPLRWGFVGVLIFMIGDGVEVSYLTDYLQQRRAAGSRAPRRRSTRSPSTASPC